MMSAAVLILFHGLRIFARQEYPDPACADPYSAYCSPKHCDCKVPGADRPPAKKKSKKKEEKKK